MEKRQWTKRWSKLQGGQNAGHFWGREEKIPVVSKQKKKFDGDFVHRRFVLDLAKIRSSKGYMTNGYMIGVLMS